jgi:predicted cation transporter
MQEALHKWIPNASIRIIRQKSNISYVVDILYIYIISICVTCAIYLNFYILIIQTENLVHKHAYMSRNPLKKILIKYRHVYY